jgi:acetyl/propionyl-CoA carboxylase alpha subunit
MGEVACTAARSVDYLNAGTIEFLVDKDRSFYFLEMNTRLQVEHPVTEMVTGVDIVREQIGIARGNPLGNTQDDIQLNGWAIECRINAEDPYYNFMPSSGILAKVSTPTGPGVRVDTGVYSGLQISPYYDSLISKLICWGETRDEAIIRMRRALDEYRVVGVKTNIPFHQRIMESHHFISGEFDTRFVEERFSIDEAEDGKEAIPHIAAILAALVSHHQTQRVAQIRRHDEEQKSGWKWAGRMRRLDK